MRSVFIICGSASIAASPALAVSSERDAVKAVVAAVRKNQLATAYPTAVSAKEVASLQRVAKCAADNLMKHKDGTYTVVWNCDSQGMLGMEVKLTGETVTTISTMEVFRRPNVQRR